MTAAVSVILWLLAVSVVLPMLVVAAQCLLGLLPTPRPRGITSRGAARPSCAVLIPAHNERLVIGATLRSVLGQLGAGDRLVVVADNCSDTTADEARSADGRVEVVERSDTERRGKGYALAAGVEHLRAAPPQVVVVIDADCTLERGALDALVNAASGGRAAQAVFIMHPPDPRNVRAVISAFAFMVKNEARPRGMHRLRLPVPLTGSGMAMPWRTIAEAALASGDIVEDLSLGLDLACEGQGPVLCPRARVVSVLPDSGAAAAKQRTRWEHGYLQTLLRRAPGLVAQAVRHARPSLVAVAIDLAVPPLSLLVMLSLAVLALCAGFGWWLGDPVPAVVVALGLTLLALSLGLSWGRYGRSYLPARAMVSIPLYVAWKLPIYLNFVRARETHWVRTQRAGESDRDKLAPDGGTGKA
jgi:cellulose synthase/poly-beta-1,6-N-acetylglucosamine synthase-like glycosyltransferase